MNGPNTAPSIVMSGSSETQGITNRPLVDEVINKPSIVTNDTRPAKTQNNINDLARSENALLELLEIESGNRNEENVETALVSTSFPSFQSLRSLLITLYRDTSRSNNKAEAR